MHDILILLNQSLFVLWTGIQVYVWAALYALKEINRRYGLWSEVRRLSPEDPDLVQRLDGKVAVISGGNRGIGLETAVVLLAKGCHVIIGCPLEEQNTWFIAITIQNRARKMSRNGIGRLDIWYLDLLSLQSVREFAQRFRSSDVKDLHLLVNNAGVMFVPKQVTIDGFESHFQVNYLSHCLLTWSLLPVLIRSGQNCGQPSRIVNVSSSCHYARDLCLNDLQSERSYSPFHSYCQSKLCQIMFTYSLNDWLLREGFGQYVTVNAVHPGVVYTQLYSNVWWVTHLPLVAKFIMRVILIRHRV